MIAVQREEGARVQGTFTARASLWDVVTQLGVVGGDTEAREGEEAVVTYMAHQVCGEEHLRRKALKELGLSTGRAVLR